MYATVLIYALFVWHFCGPTLPKSAYGKVCDVLHGRIAPLPRFFSCLARGKTVMAWLVSVFKNRWLRWAVHHHNSQRPLSFNFKLNSMIPGAAEVNEFESRSVQLQPILPSYDFWIRRFPSPYLDCRAMTFLSLAWVSTFLCLVTHYSRKWCLKERYMGLHYNDWSRLSSRLYMYIIYPF